jgi:hypothetical protein
MGQGGQVFLLGMGIEERGKRSPLTLTPTIPEKIKKIKAITVTGSGGL